MGIISQMPSSQIWRDEEIKREISIQVKQLADGVTLLLVTIDESREVTEVLRVASASQLRVNSLYSYAQAHKVYLGPYHVTLVELQQTLEDIESNVQRSQSAAPEPEKPQWSKVWSLVKEIASTVSLLVGIAGGIQRLFPSPGP